MSFELTILGCSSATPTADRHHTAQVLAVQERFFLIDCGEGTQSQLARYHIKSHRIDHILISHLHGDHYLGLMGLLSTMHLHDRKNLLHIYGPPELSDIIELQLRVSQTVLRYQLVFHPVHDDAARIVFEDDTIQVESIPMNHRIPCTGFVFREKSNPRRIRKDALERFSVPFSAIPSLKMGGDYVNPDGRVILNAELTNPAKAPRSYAFCADTCYDESIVPFIRGVNLLYHEATFAQELLQRAEETYHSTAEQAGRIAQLAGVNKLIIGHFSARYKDPAILLDEAKEIFGNTVLAEEGMKYEAV